MRGIPALESQSDDQSNPQEVQLGELEKHKQEPAVWNIRSIGSSQ